MCPMGEGTIMCPVAGQRSTAPLVRNCKRNSVTQLGLLSQRLYDTHMLHHEHIQAMTSIFMRIMDIMEIRAQGAIAPQVTADAAQHHHASHGMAYGMI